MNFIFIFISSSDTNLLRKKSVKQKIKKTMALVFAKAQIVGSVTAYVYRLMRSRAKEKNLASV